MIPINWNNYFTFVEMDEKTFEKFLLKKFIATQHTHRSLSQLKNQEICTISIFA